MALRVALIATLALFLHVHLHATEPLTGVFGENSMQRVLDNEAWLGRGWDETSADPGLHRIMAAVSWGVSWRAGRRAFLLQLWEKRTSPYGYNEWNLGGMLTFAKVHGKPFQMNEWGVWGPDAAPFVKAMAAFLKTNGARSHTYWNSNGGYPRELNQRDKEWPKTKQAFKAAFGKAK